MTKAYIERQLKDFSTEKITVTRTLGEFVTRQRMLTVEGTAGRLGALKDVVNELDPKTTIRVTLIIEELHDEEK